MSSNVSDELKNRILSSLRTPEARDALDSILDSGMVADGGISTAKLADSAVTTAKIADANITAAKLASNSVGTANIINANVTAAKLANGVVPAAPFTPTTSGDWPVVPTTVQQALDYLAARLNVLEP